MIRFAETAADLDQVYRLTHDEYIKKGYCDPQPDGRLIHYPHLDNIPETKVLMYIEAGQLIGTNSVTLDGEHGLHTDQDFVKEMMQIRLEGKVLAGSWRIVVKQGTGIHVALHLMNETVRLAKKNGVQVGVCTFHPDHEKFYRRMFRMQPVAFCPAVARLKNAPALLMRWDCKHPDIEECDIDCAHCL